MYAKIENNQVVQWPISNVAQLFPNTSFPMPMTDSSMPDGYVIVHPSPLPVINNDTHKLIESTPVQRDGKWYQQWVTQELSSEELEQKRIEKSNSVKAERKRLLSESDWTQITDAPVDKIIWAAYRQALRDITSQPGFPFKVQWPSKPE